MTDSWKILCCGLAMLVAGFSNAAAQPCPQESSGTLRPGEPPLFNTIWTFTEVRPHQLGHDISGHVCAGDQLVFRQVHSWTPGEVGPVFVMPGPALAVRWNLAPGDEIEVRRAPGGRLCFVVNLTHGNEPEPHVFFFHRAIDSTDRVMLTGRFGAGNISQCETEPSDGSHGGTLHAHDIN